MSRVVKARLQRGAIGAKVVTPPVQGPSIVSRVPLNGWDLILCIHSNNYATKLRANTAHQLRLCRPVWWLLVVCFLVVVLLLLSLVLLLLSLVLLLLSLVLLLLSLLSLVRRARGASGFLLINLLLSLVQDLHPGG